MSLFTDERNINYMKNIASVTTPFKVNIEVCLKISRHDGLQIFYNIDFGWRRCQDIPERERGYGNRNFLLLPLNFLRTIHLLFLKQYLWTIQRDFYTSIPKRGFKFWCPKEEMYLSLHWYFLCKAMFPQLNP